MNNEQEYIDKRVRISKQYSDVYGNQVGTVERVGGGEGSILHQGVAIVRMDDGSSLTVWLPDNPKGYTPECEYIQEDSKRYYVRCTYEGYMQGTYTEGKEYEVVGNWEETHTFIADTGMEFNTSSPERFTKPYTKTENTTTMNIQDKIAQLEAQQKEIQQSIAALKEEAEWKPKVGDWIYIHDGGCGIHEGTVAKLKRYDGTDWWLDTPKQGEMCANRKRFRKATQAEIDAAIPKEKVVHIGTNNTKVTISKGKITGPEGKEIPISSVKALRDCLKLATEVKGPWEVKDPVVTVGCCTSVTLKQLQEIIDEYNRING